MRTEINRDYLNENRVNLAVFETQGQCYALDVSQVREIVRFQEITPLPMSPSLIEGVIDLRNSVVPIIDLSRLLGGTRIEATERSRIVILDCDGLVLGLSVEVALDVLSLDVSTLEDVPELATQTGYEAVRHVVRRNGLQPVMVLSLEHVLEDVYRSALSQSQGEAQ